MKSLMKFPFFFFSLTEDMGRVMLQNSEVRGGPMKVWAAPETVQSPCISSLPYLPQQSLPISIPLRC